MLSPDTLFTHCDETVASLARDVQKHADGRPYYAALSDFLQGLKLNQSLKARVYRQRTASEIISSNVVSCCSDIALVFLAVDHALGGDSVFVETFYDKYLEKLRKRSMRSVENHVFLDVNGKPYEALDGPLNDYIFRNQRYIPYARGPDFTQLATPRGIVALRTTDDLREAARLFAQTYSQ